MGGGVQQSAPTVAQRNKPPVESGPVYCAELLNVQEIKPPPCPRRCWHHPPLPAIPLLIVALRTQDRSALPPPHSIKGNTVSQVLKMQAKRVSLEIGSVQSASNAVIFAVKAITSNFKFKNISSQTQWISFYW